MAGACCARPRDGQQSTRAEGGEIRCDRRGPDTRHNGNTNLYRAEGVLGVLRHGGTASTAEIEDFDEDKSSQLKESIIKAVELLCTPMSGLTDTALVQHILFSVRHYISDGGSSVQRAGHMLAQGEMPNLILVQRDPAHFVRIASRDPPFCMDGFNAQYDRLFNQRRALVPDIMNSTVWQARLMACQKSVLATYGQQGGGLSTALRHLSFAKQRFDSYAAPLRKYCCLIRAIAALLAVTAADDRNEPGMRERAQNGLAAMTAKNIFTAGLTADYAEETVRFVRLFDAHDHDPAQTPDKLQEFHNRMATLFLEAHILRPTPRPATTTASTAQTGPGAAATLPDMTMTEVVLDQCQDPEDSVYGDRVFTLWSLTSEAEVSDAQFDVAVASQQLRAHWHPWGLTP